MHGGPPERTAFLEVILVDRGFDDGVVLALGGGAGRGWAHIGFLRALEAAGIRIAGIAGTSIGAVIGAAHAAGKLDEVEQLARSTTRRSALRYLDPSFARGSILGGRTVAMEIDRRLGGVMIEDLAIPFCAVAVDAGTGETVTISTGPAHRAIMASVAIPGVFAGVSIDGRILMDGGMAANVPIAQAAGLLPGIPVIAVDLMGDYAGFAAGLRPRSSIGHVRAGFLMMMAEMSRMSERIHAPAAMIRLPIGGFPTADFSRAAELIAIGRAAGDALIGRGLP